MHVRCVQSWRAAASSSSSRSLDFSLSEAPVRMRDRFWGWGAPSSVSDATKLGLAFSVESAVVGRKNGASVGAVGGCDGLLRSLITAMFTIA